MANKTKISNLSSSQLGRLLNICSEESKETTELSGDQQRLEALEDLLSSTLPARDYDRSSLTDELSCICDISGISHGDSIRQMLLNPQTEIDQLNKIRISAKSLSKKANNDIQADISASVYYAAIASSLVFHNNKLSRLSEEGLLQTFTDLTKTPWIPSDIADLFAQAYRCLSK